MAPARTRRPEDHATISTSPDMKSSDTLEERSESERRDKPYVRRVAGWRTALPRIATPRTRQEPIPSPPFTLARRNTSPINVVGATTAEATTVGRTA